MTWQEEYKKRLTSAEDALKAIRSGDRVVIPIGCNPQLLGDTLAGRMDELTGVELAHTATGWPYLWLQPDLAGPFNVVHEHWASPLAAEALKARQHDFLPSPFSLRFKGSDGGRTASEERAPDVVLLQVTPPDENGMVNLGPHLWNQKEYIARARCTLAEVSNRIPIRNPPLKLAGSPSPSFVIWWQSVQETPSRASWPRSSSFARSLSRTPGAIGA